MPGNLQRPFPGAIEIPNIRRFRENLAQRAGVWNYTILSNRHVVQNLLMKAENDENFNTLEYVWNLADTILMVQKASTSSFGSTPTTEEIVIHELHAGFEKRTQKNATKASRNNSSNSQQSSTKNSTQNSRQRVGVLSLWRSKSHGERL